MMSRTKPAPQLLNASRYPFSMPVTPRFADMDILRHLNNLALAEFHEEARTRFFMRLFGEDFLFRKRDYRLLPVRTTYDYLHEAYYPQSLEACAGVVHIGNASFEVAMALFQAGRCVCLANVVTVHVTNAGAEPLPDVIRHQLEQGLMIDTAV